MVTSKTIRIVPTQSAPKRSLRVRIWQAAKPFVPGPWTVAFGISGYLFIQFVKVVLSVLHFLIYE
ncbi:hypothetical protein GCM10028805_52220 [Spirosoma harenae]